jgi:DNA-binding CsgD family transcriptional regulator
MSVANRLPALLVLGMLRARRGDPGAESVLDEVADMALAAARSEWRWLQGDHGQCVVEAELGCQLAVAANCPWYWGEVAIWLWRGGGLSQAPERTPAPFALQITGDWRAAAAWERIGCPYEQALALADGDEPAQRAALDIFERLGARPMVEQVRQHLRALGIRGLPRGPRPTTRGNPAGLTTRQLEVLALLAEGLRNPEIADRLSTTPKTVEHHVSAVLAKLDARSRAEAVRVAISGVWSPKRPRRPPVKWGCDAPNVGGSSDVIRQSAQVCCERLDRRTRHSASQARRTACHAIWSSVPFPTVCRFR